MQTDLRIPNLLHQALFSEYCTSQKMALFGRNRYSKHHQHKWNPNLGVQSRETQKSASSHKALHTLVTPNLMMILIFSHLITKGSSFQLYTFIFFPPVISDWGPKDIWTSFTAWGKQYTRGVSFTRHCNYIIHPPGTRRTNKQSLADSAVWVIHQRGLLPAYLTSKIGIIKQKKSNSGIVHFERLCYLNIDFISKKLSGIIQLQQPPRIENQWTALSQFHERLQLEDEKFPPMNYVCPFSLPRESSV